MNIIKFTELLDSEPTLDNLLKECNIPINSGDKIHKEYNLISELNKVVGDIEKVHKFRVAHNAKNEIEFALFDLVLISYCAEFLKKCNKSILKKKLKDILEISDPSTENTLNNAGRNTLFELLFYSYLQSVGIDCELCDPNPDITAKFGSRKYFIQCKRVFSENGKAIRSNVLSALKQVNNDLNEKDENNLGIMALSVERFFTGGNKMLVVETEEIAKKELNNNLKSIVNKYGRYWQDKSLIIDKRIVAVFLHHLAITYVLEQPRISVGHFILMNNTIYPETDNFIQASNDFRCLYSLMAP